MNIDPEKLGNNDDIEKHWAMKAYCHAETYFNLLTSIPSEKIKLTAIDKEIYTAFRSTFPDMPVEAIDELIHFKSDTAKTKWRDFIASFEPQSVEDFNFGSLLRNRSNEDYGPDNSFFVPRIQFLCIEIARNIEGANKSLYLTNSVKKEFHDSKELESEMAELQSKIVSQLE